MVTIFLSLFCETKLYLGLMVSFLSISLVRDEAVGRFLDLGWREGLLVLAIMREEWFTGNIDL
jgi:hypothetical protein